MIFGRLSLEHGVIRMSSSCSAVPSLTDLCPNGPISCPATAVYVLAVNARGPFHCHAAHLILRTAFKVDVFEVKGMDVARKVSVDVQSSDRRLQT